MGALSMFTPKIIIITKISTYGQIGEYEGKTYNPFIKVTKSYQPLNQYNSSYSV